MGCCEGDCQVWLELSTGGGAYFLYLSVKAIHTIHELFEAKMAQKPHGYCVCASKSH
jgi:hypothetical protein